MYKRDGQLETIKRFAGTGDANPLIQTTQQYDGQGRLTELKHTRFPATANTTLADYDYTYDRADRIEEMSHSTLVNPSVEAAVSEGTSTFTYETTVPGGLTPLSDQVVQGVHGNGHGNETFGYDANGNRNTNGFTPTIDNRYSSDGTYTYEYDNEGNIKRRTKTGETIDFVWDHHQRLIEVSYKDGAYGTGNYVKRVLYRYDAFDRRIEKLVLSNYVNGTHTFAFAERYFYDGHDLLYVTDGNYPDTLFGRMQTRYLPGPAVDQVFADETIVGELLWTLPDHQGTPRDFARNTDDYGNPSGFITNHLWYTSFGQPNERVSADRYYGSLPVWSLTNPASWRHLRTGYTSFEYDPDTKGAFSWTRVYFAEMGRWLNQDPIGFLGDTSNPYRYVTNSPVNFEERKRGRVQLADSARGAWTA